MYVRYQVPVARQGPAGHADPWLLPHRQDLGDDARRPHGLGRVLRARGLPDLRDRPGRRAAARRSIPRRSTSVKIGKAPAADCRRSSRPATRPRGRSSASGRSTRRSSTACSSRCRRRRSSGSRWWPTGPPALPTPNPTVPALSQLAIKLGGTDPDQPFAVGHLSLPDRGAQHPGHRRASCRSSRAAARPATSSPTWTSRRWCCSATMSTCRRAGRRG